MQVVASFRRAIDLRGQTTQLTSEVEYSNYSGKFLACYNLTINNRRHMGGMKMLNSKEIIVDKTNTEMIHTGARNRIYARAASLLLATMVAFGAAGCGKTAKEQGKIETENSLEASTGNVQEAQEEKEAPGSNTKKADSADTAADKNQKVPSGRSAASGNGSQDTGKNKPSGQAGNEGQAAGKNKSSGSSGNKSSSRSASSDNRKI